MKDIQFYIEWHVGHEIKWNMILLDYGFRNRPDGDIKKRKYFYLWPLTVTNAST